MIRIDTIFFDVDGTLVDARKDIVKAINFALSRMGVKPPPSKQVVSYIGTGVKDLVKKSLGEPNAGLIDKTIDIFSEYYIKHATDETKLYPHVREILEYFNDKRKFIITNRYSRFADTTLKGFGIRKYFEEILGGDDENCMKPSACVLDRFISKLNIDKRRALIIGDMVIDVQTGKNSGIKTCFVTYGLGKLKEAKALRPDYIIKDLLELKDVIA